MSSRTHILTTLRQEQGAEVPHPGSFLAAQASEDVLGKFQEMLRVVSGQSRLCPNREAAWNKLHELKVFQDAGILFSAVPSLELRCQAHQTYWSPASEIAVHRYAEVDLCILEGLWGVAENGAIWIDNRQLPQQVVAFLTQHLVILISRGSLLPHMHQAYSKLDFGKWNYGCWIAGPSKTADIEQALVVGAHGARSLNVLIY